MGRTLEFLSGKKTYLLALAYIVLVMTGFAVPDEQALSLGERLQDSVLAGGLAALRAGVAKVIG